MSVSTQPSKRLNLSGYEEVPGDEEIDLRIQAKVGTDTEIGHLRDGKKADGEGVDAKTVNGKTVAESVPEGAAFTDTQRQDSEITGIVDTQINALRPDATYKNKESVFSETVTEYSLFNRWWTVARNINDYSGIVGGSGIVSLAVGVILGSLRYSAKIDIAFRRNYSPSISMIKSKDTDFFSKIRLQYKDNELRFQLYSSNRLISSAVVSSVVSSKIGSPESVWTAEFNDTSEFGFTDWFEIDDLDACELNQESAIKLSAIEKGAQRNANFTMALNRYSTGDYMAYFIRFIHLGDDGEPDGEFHPLWLQFGGETRPINLGSNTPIFVNDENPWYLVAIPTNNDDINYGVFSQEDWNYVSFLAARKFGNTWKYYLDYEWHVLDQDRMDRYCIVGYCRNNATELISGHYYERAYRFEDAPSIAATRTRIHPTSKKLEIDNEEQEGLLANDTENVAGEAASQIKSKAINLIPGGEYEELQSAFLYGKEQAHGESCPTAQASTYAGDHKGILLRVKRPILLTDFSINPKFLGDDTVTFKIEKFNSDHTAKSTYFEIIEDVDVSTFSQYTKQSLASMLGLASLNIVLSQGDYYVSLVTVDEAIQFACLTTSNAKRYANNLYVAIQGNVQGASPNWATLWNSASTSWYCLFKMEFYIQHRDLYEATLQATPTADDVLDGAHCLVADS